MDTLAAVAFVVIAYLVIGVIFSLYLEHNFGPRESYKFIWFDIVAWPVGMYLLWPR